MKLQQVLSLVRKAIDEYHMIEDGDKIAIGISGGKDSLTLLYALHGLKRFYPKKFDIYAVTVDLGFNNLNLDEIEGYSHQMDNNTMMEIKACLMEIRKILDIE